MVQIQMEDALTYIYNWFVDEQPTNHTTDSISASETLFGQNGLVKSKVVMAMLKVKRSVWKPKLSLTVLLYI